MTQTAKNQEITIQPDTSDLRERKAAAFRLYDPITKCN